jgi:hypothetical protein
MAENRGLQTLAPHPAYRGQDAWVDFYAPRRSCLNSPSYSPDVNAALSLRLSGCARVDRRRVSKAPIPADTAKTAVLAAPLAVRVARVEFQLKYVLGTVN